jgi:hypothetical protein
MEKIKKIYTPKTKYKICSRCDTRKPLKSFDKQTLKGKTYYKPYCSACKSKCYREKHPEVRKEIANRGKIKYRQKRFQMKYDLMKSIGQIVCKECGYTDIRALTFHHRDPHKKSFEISYGFTHSYSFDTLLEEVKKCDVLCQNCHTISHCSLDVNIENLS